MEIHPSFYQIIRKHRLDPSVSDDQFIASLITALKKSTNGINECGHGANYSQDGECLVCKTFAEEQEWADHLNDIAQETKEFIDD